MKHDHYISPYKEVVLLLQEKSLHTKIGSYVSTLLRSNFGKGPTSVFVSIKRPFITIHFRGFLAPMEAILMKQKEVLRVLETRDLMMNDLRSDIILEFWKIAELEVKEIYADWNLENKTGMIIAELNEEPDAETMQWPSDIDQKAFEEEINAASLKAEKVPGKTESFWLNDRTILVKRSQILVRIEKELIEKGFVEELKLAKRPLEHKVMKEVSLEAVLKRNVSEMFVDWNFDQDISYSVFLLGPAEDK
jgi:uncharacterized protein YbcI